MCYSFFSFGIKKAQSFSFSVLCVLGGFRSHGSSNLFSIGKYPFFIYEIEHKNFALKKRKSLEKSRLFGAISFLSPFDGGPEGNRTPVRKPLDMTFSGCSLLFGFPLGQRQQTDSVLG